MGPYKEVEVDNFGEDTRQEGKQQVVNEEHTLGTNSNQASDNNDNDGKNCGDPNEDIGGMGTGPADDNQSNNSGEMGRMEKTMTSQIQKEMDRRRRQTTRTEMIKT
jgi:hypothetical protein